MHQNNVIIHISYGSISLINYIQNNVIIPHILKLIKLLY